MDLKKLQIIRDEILSIELEDKKESDEFAGIYCYGDNKPFILKDHVASFHSFRVFSQYNYPIYFFINRHSISKEDLEFLQKTYKNIKVCFIRPLSSWLEYNIFYINEIFRLIDKNKHNNLATFQEDGMFIKSGWENYAINFSFIGAWWKNAIKLKTDCFNFPPVSCANGGMSFRKLDKVLKVIELVDKLGGQENIIRGQYVQNNQGIFDLRVNNFCIAEDAFFSYVGFGSEIFEPITKDQCDIFSLEPIEINQFKNKRAFAFHRVD